MGAEFKFSHGYLEARCERLQGADIIFDFPSVGATENLLTAAVFAEGRTTIDNAAREPEIIDLCNFLVSMGADISGIGTSTLVIDGVERDALRPVRHHTVPTAFRRPPTSRPRRYRTANSTCSASAPTT